MNIQDIKNRFGIIGGSPLLERAMDIARQVASTDLSVLVTGESGTGKEVFPQIIHQLSSRKHGSYIAVNCGAIPEGTIDSELFGHEKGSFTGAHEARKGYFEVANNGTIFLDEVAELPLGTQVRLLRVLETGEFIKVGSSKVQKTNVRIIAATNVNIPDAVQKGKFREDLYYRLNTVPIAVPPLRKRKEDICLLFKKFASDFGAKYRMPNIQLTPEAESILTGYYWPGNIRQLKNVAEQISVIEKKREIDADTVKKYLPEKNQSSLPALVNGGKNEEFTERELLYKVLFDMKKDLTDLKKVVADLMRGKVASAIEPESPQVIRKLYRDIEKEENPAATGIELHKPSVTFRENIPMQEHAEAEVIEESLSIQERERELIIKALEKFRGKRKNAAKELGISERTLYRKIKEYGIKE